MRYLKATTVLTAVLFVGGCGDSTGPDNPGFDATISGDLELSITGDAIFGVSSQGGVDRWMIFLSDGFLTDTVFDAIAIGREASGSPIGLGTHSIQEAGGVLDPDEISALYMLQRSDVSLGIFRSLSGTLAITDVSDEQVTGEFSFSAVVLLEPGGAMAEAASLNVSGSFTAEPGAIPSFSG